MKRICRRFMVSAVLLAGLNVLPIIGIAQPGSGDGDPGDPDAPIDGGLSILVAAGVGYGIKRANDQRKRNKAREIEFPKQSGL